MRANKLIRVAAEAEILRIQHMLKRQGVRAAFGLVAVVFALGTLVFINVIGWQVLRQYVQPVYASLIMLGINLVIALVLAILAMRSSPSRTEREALVVHQQAIQEVQASLALTTLVPLAGTLIRSSRRGSRRWLFGQKRIR